MQDSVSISIMREFRNTPCIIKLVFLFVALSAYFVHAYVDQFRIYSFDLLTFYNLYRIHEQLFRQLFDVRNGNQRTNKA